MNIFRKRVWIMLVLLIITVATAFVTFFVCRHFVKMDGTVEPEEVFVDTTAPVVEGEDIVTIYKNDVTPMVDHFSAQDDSGEEVGLVASGECDTTVVQSCMIKVTATDASGNEATREFTVNVVVDPEIVGGPEYYIKVNRLLNTVMVYARDRSGGYTNLVKTFVASTGAAGNETPTGIYSTSVKYESLYLVGNVWGRYAVRIVGRYYFHSVPYFSKGNPTWDNLEYLEYNKLGEAASAGCVRLAVRDVKWIYDNVSAGTTVEIYDADTLPEGVVKPLSVKIDPTSALRGWDPTDWDLPK